jgi:hypothetical protein
MRDERGKIDITREGDGEGREKGQREGAERGEQMRVRYKT